MAFCDYTCEQDFTIIGEVLFFHLYSPLAHLAPTFTADMTTYYYWTIEEALRKAKAAGKRPGCWYGGIVLRSGRRGFAVYREGKVVEQYTALK